MTSFLAEKLGRRTMPLLLTLFLPSLLAAQTRYLDEVFDAVSVERAIEYGSAVNTAGERATLLLDIYTPLNDAAERRPLLILAHGGGFMTGSRVDPNIDTLSRRFARMGWSVASIDYRLQPTFDDGLTALLAVVQGIQDMKGAIRFFYRQSEQYRVDTTLIVVGGVSAGAIMALHAGLVQEEETILLTNPDLLKALGGLEGTSGSAGYSSRVAGVINMWGGIADTMLISSDDVPIVSVHGTEDPTVPYEYLARSPWDTVGSSLYGSAPITRTARRLTIPTALLPFEGYQHGLGRADSPEYAEATRFIAEFLWRTYFGVTSVEEREGEQILHPTLR